MSAIVLIMAGAPGPRQHDHVPTDVMRETMRTSN